MLRDLTLWSKTNPGPPTPSGILIFHTELRKRKGTKYGNYGRGSDTNKIHQYTVKQRPKSMIVLPAIYEPMQDLLVEW
jgi:hypothetical protein